MSRPHRFTDEELYMIGVYVVLVLVFLSVMFSGCIQGPRGGTGVTGAVGPSGAPGLNGTSPTITTQPATSFDCPNGGVEITINNTATTIICNGMDGATGPQGEPGVNATPITIIQLCPGVTPQYPSTFPEIGLCINGNLYGVYSANDGFLSLLTPGTYISNGINASCTLTVLPNCVVQ